MAVATAEIFDVRIIDNAVTETSGNGASTDRGAVSYYYNDVKDNEGLVVLPTG